MISKSQIISADDNSIIKRLKTPQQMTSRYNEFTKVSGYKVNIQKPITFLYSNNESIEKEVKKTIPFPISLK